MSKTQRVYAETDLDSLVAAVREFEMVEAAQKTSVQDRTSDDPIPALDVILDSADSRKQFFNLLNLAKDTTTHYLVNDDDTQSRVVIEFNQTGAAPGKIHSSELGGS